MVMHGRKMCGRSVSGHGMSVGRWFDNNLQKGRLFAWKDDRYLWQSFEKYVDSYSHMDRYLLCGLSLCIRSLFAVWSIRRVFYNLSNFFTVGLVLLCLGDLERNKFVFLITRKINYIIY